MLDTATCAMIAGEQTISFTGLPTNAVPLAIKASGASNDARPWYDSGVINDSDGTQINQDIGSSYLRLDPRVAEIARWTIRDSGVMEMRLTAALGAAKTYTLLYFTPGT